MHITSRTDPELIRCLLAGGVAVFRADTIYGIFARADDEAAVARVFAAKGRDPHKSCIILVSSPSQLYDRPPAMAEDFLAEVWPRPVSVILPSPSAPPWLDRVGDGTIAYRCPADEDLRQLLAQTGPLIAPSANPESLPPAEDCQQAEAYFGDKVDIYVDGGPAKNAQPSALYRILPDGQRDRLR